MALRVDNAEQVGTFERLPNGWLRTQGFLTRPGVFMYRQLNGQLRAEFRPPEEVFRSETLKSFSMLPVTDGHPPQFLDSTNTAQFQVGQLGDTVTVTDGKATAAVLLTRQDTIDRAETGQARALSVGFTCDTDCTPGVYNGTRYDIVQRNIQGNHVALVPVGRAGAECSIRMDEADAGEVSTIPVSEAKLLQEKISSLENQVSQLTKARDLQQGRADSAEDLLGKERALRQDSIPLAELNARVQTRIALLEKAKQLAPELRCDALSDHEIRVQALGQKDQSYKDTLVGKSEEYVLGVFDALVKAVPAPSVIRIDAQDAFFPAPGAAPQKSEARAAWDAEIAKLFTSAGKAGK